MDKKKSRDVERMKKRDVRKEKDERKGDKSSKEVNKIKKEDDRPPIKVYFLNMNVNCYFVIVIIYTITKSIA